jgi:hypothetical protein
MRLAHDESLWAENSVRDYPQFGDSTWPWAPASNQDATSSARNFYKFWTNFVTAKDFSWFDQWEINDAPDRRVRRYVQQPIMPLIAYGLISCLVQWKKRTRKLVMMLGKNTTKP